MAELKMPNINQVALTGRLTQDPESQITESNKLRVTFNIAANFNYRDKKGDWQQDTTFVPISAWDKVAEAVAQNLRKGSGVFLTGRLRSRSYETSSGNRTVLEIVAKNVQFLDKKEDVKEPQEEYRNEPRF